MIRKNLIKVASIFMVAALAVGSMSAKSVSAEELTQDAVIEETQLPAEEQYEEVFGSVFYYLNLENIETPDVNVTAKYSGSVAEARLSVKIDKTDDSKTREAKINEALGLINVSGNKASLVESDSTGSDLVESHLANNLGLSAVTYDMVKESLASDSVFLKRGKDVNLFDSVDWYVIKNETNDTYSKRNEFKIHVDGILNKLPEYSYEVKGNFTVYNPDGSVNNTVAQTLVSGVAIAGTVINVSDIDVSAFEADGFRASENNATSFTVTSDNNVFELYYSKDIVMKNVDVVVEYCLNLKNIKTPDENASVKYTGRLYKDVVTVSIPADLTGSDRKNAIAAALGLTGKSGNFPSLNEDGEDTRLVENHLKDTLKLTEVNYDTIKETLAADKAFNSVEGDVNDYNAVNWYVLKYCAGIPGENVNDTTLHVDGVLEYIEEEEPTPEPTPIVTPEPTPIVTPEPTPIVTPEPTPVPNQIPVVLPDVTPTPEPEQAVVTPVEIPVEEEEPVAEEEVAENEEPEEVIENVENVETPQGLEDDIDVDAVDTPQSDAEDAEEAQLPKTGVVSAVVFYGIGAACVAFGGAIVKKTNRKEEE